VEIHGERSEKVLPAIRHLGDDTQRDVPQATREAEGEATNYQPGGTRRYRTYAHRQSPSRFGSSTRLQKHHMKFVRATARASTKPWPSRSCDGPTPCPKDSRFWRDGIVMRLASGEPVTIPRLRRTPECMCGRLARSEDARARRESTSRTSPRRTTSSSPVRRNGGRIPRAARRSARSRRLYRSCDR
jgi:hypothetical protein